VLNLLINNYFFKTVGEQKATARQPAMSTALLRRLIPRDTGPFLPGALCVQKMVYLMVESVAALKFVCLHPSDDRVCPIGPSSAAMALGLERTNILVLLAAHK